MITLKLTNLEFISVNRFRKLDPHTQRAKIRKFKQQVSHQVGLQLPVNFDKVTSPVHVSLNLYGEYLADLDNMLAGYALKSILDVLVSFGIVEDDCLKHVQRITLDYKGRKGNCLEIKVRHIERP